MTGWRLERETKDKKDGNTEVTLREKRSGQAEGRTQRAQRKNWEVEEFKVESSKLTVKRSEPKKQPKRQDGRPGSVAPAERRTQEHSKE